ncbi:MAG: hypothetical protein GPJ54_22260 [Candidatus Heimdallarchaeota archaeon]|nr:hypothetical protein [Candidatus Heimdallarchaeota archaeon]
MNRRGQIFLLLTILSITFIFAVSTILLDIQRAQYLEPAPDVDETFEAWDNTVDSIEQILNVQIAINTQAGALLGNYAPQINNELVGVENYLLGRGLIASIDLDGPATYTPPTTTLQDATASILALFSIQIQSSSGNSIIQSLDFAIQYDVNLVGTTLTLSKTVNGITTYLSGATVDTVGTIDNANGAYTLPGGLPSATPIVVTTPNNVRLIVETP